MAERSGNGKAVAMDCSDVRESEMIASCVGECDYCRSLIGAGEKWVREKVYDPAPNPVSARYFHFHGEPSPGQELSCWEKHQMQREASLLAA